MKQSKKLLSIFLALVMLLGSFSVIASAAQQPVTEDTKTSIAYDSVDNAALTPDQVAFIILDMLDKAKKEYKHLRDIVTHDSSNDIEDTSPTFKIMEEGATALSKEEAGALAQRQYKFIQNLEAALIRIENKTYGVCRMTGKLIPKERLRLVPHATLTVEAKEMMNKK